MVSQIFHKPASIWVSKLHTKLSGRQDLVQEDSCLGSGGSLDSVLSAIATILYVALRAGHEVAAQWLAPP